MNLVVYFPDNSISYAKLLSKQENIKEYKEPIEQKIIKYFVVGSYIIYYLYKLYNILYKYNLV